MGGSGSSRWGWYTKKATCEAARRIRPTDLRSGRGWLSWQYNGRPSGDMAYTMAGDGRAVCFEYANKTTGAQFSYTVQIVGTASNLPGHTETARRFFVCPVCGRRAGVLYLAYGSGPTFACRVCCGLVYRSAQTAHADEPRGMVRALLDMYAGGLEAWRASSRAARKRRRARKSTKCGSV